MTVWLKSSRPGVWRQIVAAGVIRRAIDRNRRADSQRSGNSPLHMIQMVVGQQHLLKAAGGMMFHQIRSSGIEQRHGAVERDHSATGAAVIFLAAAGAVGGRPLEDRHASRRWHQLTRRRCRVKRRSGSSCHLLFIPVDPLRAPRGCAAGGKFIDRLSELPSLFNVRQLSGQPQRAARSRRWAISARFPGRAAPAAGAAPAANGERDRHQHLAVAFPGQRQMGAGAVGHRQSRRAARSISTPMP